MSGMSENKSSISKAETLEAIGEFWDEHDFTEFDTDAPDVIFNISSHVAIESELLSAVEKTGEHARCGFRNTRQSLVARKVDRGDGSSEIAPGDSCEGHRSHRRDELGIERGVLPHHQRNRQRPPRPALLGEKSDVHRKLLRHRAFAATRSVGMMRLRF